MAAHFCPMHANVRASERGKCPVCGMALVADEALFPLLRHLFGNPLHLAAVAIVMAILMGGAMMFLQ